MSEEKANSKFYFVGNNLCLNFVNTEVVENGERVDLLTCFDDLVRWSVETDALDAAQAKDLLGNWSGKPEAESVLLLARARGFRRALRLMAERITQGKSLPQSIIAAVNEVLSQQRGFAEVVRVRGGGYERRVRTCFSEPAQLLVPIAESASELLCNSDLSLVRRCENPACILYFFDTTKNHARRWCSMSGCGNRAKVAAHYERTRIKAREEE